jgi:L-fuconolactonase
MKIDAEVFFWKYEKPVTNSLIRDNKQMQQHWLPEQISQSLQRNGIDGCIATAGESAELETRFLSELAMTHPAIRGVIGWLDLHHEKVIEKIEEFLKYTPIRGYAVDLNQQVPPGPAVMEKLLTCQYSLDLSLGTETNPSGISEWISSNREQAFILQHGGNPDTTKPPSAGWEKRIRDLSKNQNLFCKVSGLLERGNRKSWKPADLYPFLEILFDSFGPDRLLYASDWPFLLLSGIYVQWKSLLEKFMEKFSFEERDSFFGANAERIYRLKKNNTISEN